MAKQTTTEVTSTKLSETAKIVANSIAKQAELQKADTAKNYRTHAPFSNKGVVKPK